MRVLFLRFLLLLGFVIRVFMDWRVLVWDWRVLILDWMRVMPRRFFMNFMFVFLDVFETDKHMFIFKFFGGWLFRI